MRQDELDHVASPWLAQLVAGAHWRTAAACEFADPALFFPMSAPAKNPQQVALRREDLATTLGPLQTLRTLRTRWRKGLVRPCLPLLADLYADALYGELIGSSHSAA